MSTREGLYREKDGRVGVWRAVPAHLWWLLFDILSIFSSFIINIHDLLLFPLIFHLVSPPPAPHLSLGFNSVIRLQPQNQRGRDRKSWCKKQKCITKYIIWFIFSTKMCIKIQNMFVKRAQMPHLYNKGFKWGNFEIDFNKNHLIDRD